MDDKKNITTYLKDDERIIKTINFTTDIISLKQVGVGSFLYAEKIFETGKKVIIDDTLPRKKIETILKKLEAGQPLSDDERQHVLTAQEFYRSHEQMFLTRAEETACTARELEFIAKTLVVPKGSPVLDVGCGLGRLTHPLLKMGYNMYGIDVSSHLILRARVDNPSYKDRFLIASLFNQPFRRKHFSAIIMMWHVICEVSHNVDTAFAEAASLLKSGGILILDVPDASSDDTKIKYQGPPGQENYAVFLAKIPPMTLLKRSLESSGFKIIHIEHFLWGIHKFVIVCKKK